MRIPGRITVNQYIFQSHNGLILIRFSLVDCILDYQFQSHNGLILINVNTNPAMLRSAFQSHNGLILINIHESVQCRFFHFNPIMVLF